MSRSASIVRADGQVVTTAFSTDLVQLQTLAGSNSGQFEPRLISVANLLSGGTDVLTLNLGSSGNAGTLNIFPGTASKGSLKFVAASNTGNTVTTITNAAMGQASVISFPDPGASTANVVLSAGTQTLAGTYTFSVPPIGEAVPIQVYLSTITAQAGAVSVLFVAPYGGTVTKVAAAVGGAFTATNIVITPSVYTAPGTGTAITGGAVTLATASSGVGTTATVTPSAANTFASGNVITATVTGGVGTVTGVITLYVTRTA
jgi:hypothetical protein